MKEYYHNQQYTIYKMDKWFFIIPNSVNDKLNFVSLIANKTIFDLRKMSKKDILYYLDEINKIVDSINKLGYQKIPSINVDKLKEANQNNNSKEFEKLLQNALLEVQNISIALGKCEENNKTIAGMFNIVMRDEISDKDFINWIVANPFICYSCDNFSQVRKIYEEQKSVVSKKADDSLDKVNLGSVDSMPSNIEKFSTEKMQTNTPLNYNPLGSTTLDKVGLDPTGEVSEKNTTTFVMDSNGSKDNNDTVIYPGEKAYDEGGNPYGQQKSNTRTLSKPGAKFGYYPTHNEWNKAAFTNWYGIILTLIFSFAIGYLIAWIFIRVH